jgi:hypothetical protein
MVSFAYSVDVFDALPEASVLAEPPESLESAEDADPPSFPPDGVADEADGLFLLA